MIGQSAPGTSEWVLACSLSAFAERPIIALSHGDRHIIVLRDGERVIATDRACPHEGADLARGRCADGKLYCPRHYAWFDLTDGKVSPGWAFSGLHLYPTKIVDRQVWIALPATTQKIAGHEGPANA